MSKKRKRVQVGQFGPLSGPVTAACTSMAVAGWGAVFDVSPWYAVAGATACGLLTLAQDTKRRLPQFARWTHLSAWGFYGWWTWDALATTPWSVDGIATLATGSAVAVVATKAAAVHTENVREHEQRVEEVARRRGLAGEWEGRIDRVCRIKGVRVTGLDDWERPVPDTPGKTRKTGYSVLLELPAGGYRWTDISAKRLELGSDADLPEGCGVEVRRGPTARQVIVDVSTVNVLAEDLPLPSDFENASIYDPVRFGITPDGQIAQVHLKWTSALLIGQKGSGKSNQLVTLMSQLLACDDVLIWGIDFNGGGVFRPYLKPWLNGDASRPAIDWVATDEAETEEMLDFAIGAIPARKIGYADLMEEADDDKVPSSTAVPHILIVTDESNDLPQAIKQKLVEISNRGRGASVSTLVCALRAVDAGGKGLPIELNAQAAVKISMQVDGDQELAYLFNWGKAPRCEEIPGVGFGVFGEEGSVPRLFKGFRTKPSSAREAAAKTSGRRPLLDALTHRVAPGVYDSRWERAKESWLSGKQAPQKASQGAPAGSSRPGAPSGPVNPAAGGDVAMEAMRKAMRDSGLPVPGEAHEKPQETAGDDGLLNEFDEIVERGLSDVGAPPRLLAVCVDAFEGDSRALLAVLAKAAGMPSRELSGLLRQVGIEPLPHPFTRGGTSGKGYERAVFEETIRRIRSGEIAVPDAVRDAL